MFHISNVQHVQAVCLLRKGGLEMEVGEVGSLSKWSLLLWSLVRMQSHTVYPRCLNGGPRRLIGEPRCSKGEPRW